MRDNRTREETDYYNMDDERTSLLGKGQQPVQERKDWDVFTNDPPVEITGSMADRTCIEVSLQIVKVLAYICTFIFVLGGALLSKGTLLFMTSQLRTDVNVRICDKETGNQDSAPVPPEGRVGWIWCLFFACIIPEILTFLWASRMCFFKNVTKPTILQFCVVATAEALKSIGTGLLVFMILPNLNVVRGAMLTNCLCFVPGLIALFNGLQEEVNGRPGAAYYVRHTMNGLAVAAQLTGLLAWPIENGISTRSFVHPIALLLISCGWWENFMAATKKPAIAEFLKGLQDCRYYTLLYVPVLKTVCFFCTMLMATLYHSENTGVEGLFKPLGQIFTQPHSNFTVNLTSGVPYEMFITTSSALWVLLIHALGSYICYISGVFACRILIQEIGFALPVTITVPVIVPSLVALCLQWISDPCSFKHVIPRYMFFSYNNGDQNLIDEHALMWMLWLLSQFWITLHIWKPNVDRLMSTEVLFTMPMYDSMFVDQSLALNRRHDKEREEKIEGLGDVGREENIPGINHSQKDMIAEDDPVRDTDHIRRVFACITLWHETADEMKQMLKSIFRMDSDQAARRLAQKHLRVVDPDYYEFEAHIFFDDAFKVDEDTGEVVVNDYVTDLMDTVDIAATEVHGTECRIRPPVMYPTPYGGRLVWTLPGKTNMVVHLKNKDKIRHKKRWSQVMYMYYLLGHRLMQLPIHPKRKEVIASNTFILALDGDIDFKPEAVLLLLDRMRIDPNLGAACGRIHPTGEGAMVWYQMFEYAIGHWMQKATEHVIGCVLCSPGCFSLFRGEALMDDAVMNKYTTVSTEARHYVQYDQGEDRWLCTLLLQRGYRVEYSAASDSFTKSPESFEEFYKQRRRWIPSTMANILDLLNSRKQTVKINDNISFLYIIYQIGLFIGSILGPGSIFLMLVGALVAAFRIPTMTSFWLNIVPILIFMFVCYFCKEPIQLTAAKIISAIYGLLMMAVLIGIMLQIMEDGPLAPASLFFFIVAGGIIIAAILHPQEILCLPAGVVFYVTIPSMYMLLIVYAIFNLNNVSWGTREDTNNKSKKELEQEKKAAEEEKKQAKQKSFWDVLRRDQKSKGGDGGSCGFSKNGLFTCICCAKPDGREESLQSLRIEGFLEKLNRRLDDIERAVDPEKQTQQRRRTTTKLNYRDLDPVMESEENNMDADTNSFTDNEDNRSEVERNDDVTPYWIDQIEKEEAAVDFLPTHEVVFWNELIKQYLRPLNKDAKKQEKDSQNLRDLRDRAAAAFFMVNVLFVLIIFLLQLSNDQLFIHWPFGIKATVSLSEISGEIIISRQHLQLEPIGVAFVVCFGFILIIQFIGMCSHRFGTLSHILATTQITLCKRAAQDDDRDLDAPTAIQFVKDMQVLRGADGDEVKEQELMQESVGRRKTVINIDKSHKFLQDKTSVHSLEGAFKRRLTKVHDGGVLPERYRKLTTARRDTILRLMDTARKSVSHEGRPHMYNMRRNFGEHVTQIPGYGGTTNV